MNHFIKVLPLLAGMLSDAIIGDPYELPHPVRLMGCFIGWLDQKLLGRCPGASLRDVKGAKGEVKEGDRELADRDRKKELRYGVWMVVLVAGVSTILPAVLLYIMYQIDLWAGVAAESICCCYLLAARCLQKESTKVYRALQEGNLEQARTAVSMIVGRDTDVLDAEGVAKAAVETVAESTCDGVTAPLFYMAFGGAVGGFFYKAVNTMDSMIGYRNVRYVYFGRAAARLDDVLNYLPSRLTALLMVVAAYVTGMDGAGAWRIWRRDRRKHKSPNSAQTEAACAGALNVCLAGDGVYGGKLLHKEIIGDGIRPVEAEDIPRANQLMYASAGEMLIVSVLVRLAVIWLM